MHLVTLPKEEISKECRDQALQIKRQVELLQLQGKKSDGSNNNNKYYYYNNELEARLKDAPDPAREIAVCMRGFCEGCMTWLSDVPWAIWTVYELVVGT